MTETVERQQIPAELSLRRERSEMPHEIAVASELVQNLRGAGLREGDPELEEALQTIRELAARERALPDLIVDAVAERCESEAAALREQERVLVLEAEELQSEAARAQRASERAQRKAREVQSRVEGHEIRRDLIRREATPFEDFARGARELEGEKRLRLLEEARVDGLLLPFGDVVAAQ